MSSLNADRASRPIECGKEAAKEFALAAGYHNLNHGSYGTYPLAVRSAFRDYMDQYEVRPDAFIRFEYRTNLLDASRKVITNYLNVPFETCVFVPNTSNGIDTVLRNISYKPGDVVICFADLYGSFSNTLQYLAETTPLEYKKIEYTHPLTDSHVCEAFEKAIDELKRQNKTPKLAVFDAISSIPGIRMPFERLTKICRDHGVYSCVDGAHAIGHIPLDLVKLDPDFFVSNCHKWLYVPRPCAIFYVPVRNQHLLRATLPTGWGYGAGFAENFADLGTLNNSPYLCVETALAWRSRLVWEDKRGEEAVMGYNQSLARSGGAAVKEILGTEILENSEGTLGKCNFTNLRLPLSLAELTGGDSTRINQLLGWFMKVMTVEYQAPMYIYQYGDGLWTRLGAQVYLTIDDFIYAGEKLKEACERAKKGEWISK